MKHLLSAIILLLASSYVIADGYEIRDYNIKVNISQEGHYDIQETIVVFFDEQRRGIFRNIPKKYSINGKTHEVWLSHVSVAHHKYRILNEGSDKVIRIGDKNTFLTGEQTYILSYRISNGFLFEEDHVAFQYNLISDWDTEIRNLTYSIQAPDDADLSDSDLMMMTGIKGDRNKHVSMTLNGNVISGKSLTLIPAEENVTLAIKFAPGFIQKPINPLSWEAAKKKKGWMAPAAGLALLLTTFFRSRKRNDHHDNIPDQYYPPEGFSPALVGAYHDHKVHTEDIIALLPYWADKGYIKILKGVDQLFFKQLSKLPSSAPEYQQTMYNAIFRSGDMVVLEELKEKIYGKLASAKKALHDQVIYRELYDQREWNTFHSGKMLYLGILLLVASALIGFIFHDFIAVVATAILGIACMIIHKTTPRLSQKGIDLKNHLIGLKSHLKDGDPEQTAILLKDDPQYFEKLYPYAIALGVDKTWMKRIEEAEIPEPHWYDRHESYPVDDRQRQKSSLRNFGKEFMIREIASVFVSAPQPEPGSSSSGGGFSSGGAGGGFGGGGGAW